MQKVSIFLKSNSSLLILSTGTVTGTVSLSLSSYWFQYTACTQWRSLHADKASIFLKLNNYYSDLLIESTGTESKASLSDSLSTYSLTASKVNSPGHWALHILQRLTDYHCQTKLSKRQMHYLTTSQAYYSVYNLQEISDTNSTKEYT